ncbi:hypothetical protein EV132_1038 [Rhizobium sullae]|uniref:Uncharacterized protein n=1 Tax=Rhizobium sullae TaxID=50338 RepID=A0A4R3QE60_RHISU|nr:hypothetical protein EV132_1038 [Rhizobium sullae]
MTSQPREATSEKKHVCARIELRFVFRVWRVFVV